MRSRLTALLAALAWVALLLPWERCVSDCHDRVVPAVAEHECYDHEEPPAEHGEESRRHERIEFASVTPAAPVVLALPAEGSATAQGWQPAARLLAASQPSLFPPGELRTTVLLL